MEMEYSFSEIRESWVSELLFPQFKTSDKEVYQIDDILRIIREMEKKDTYCIYLIGDSGYGKTQSAREILRRAQNDSGYATFLCDGKNLDLEAIKMELQEKKNEKKTIVCFDGFNNLSDSMMKETAKFIFELCKSRIVVMVTTIKVPPEINEIMHVEFGVQKIEEGNRKEYLKEFPDEKGNKLIRLLESPILLRMVKETGKLKGEDDYVQYMKENCQTAADVFWNYNLHFIGNKRDSDEKEWRKKGFTFKFLTGIIADIMWEKGGKIHREMLVGELKKESRNGYIAYCLQKEGLKEHWFQKENSATECIDLLVKLNVMQDRDLLFFSHDLYLEFYLALHEYNLTYWIINKNEKFTPKVTLNDKVGNFYFKLFDDNEIERLKGEVQMKCEDHEENYRARKAYDVLSDIYYYGNGSSVIERDIDSAYRYSEEAYNLGDGWATWNCVYLLKEKAQKLKKEGNEEAAVRLYKNGFNMIKNYLICCEKKNIEKYYAVYDVFAQYYIYGWLEETSDENTRYKIAEEYLLKAEEGKYMYSYNKHARLFEEGKLEVVRGENKYVKAYELYESAAKQNEIWAVAIVALYKWHLYNVINNHKLVKSKKEARERAREYLESVYQKEEEFTRVIALERRDRYKNGYVNLGLIYVEKGEEEQHEDKKRDCFLKAYEYYAKAHDIDSKDINVCLMLFYLQIRLGKELDEEWIGFSLEGILENKKLSREYKDWERTLGLDSGKRYQRKLQMIVKFSEKMSENSRGKESCEDSAWSPYKYMNLVCQVIDFAEAGMTVESVFKLVLERAGVEKDIQKMVEESNLVPGVLLTFGDEVQKKVIVYGKKQEVLLSNNHFEMAPEELEDDSLIDLASITKIFTCIITMKLFELKEINIDDPIGKYDTRFTNISLLKIRELMDFTVPLRTDKHIGRADTADIAEQSLFAIREDRENLGSRYSDMGAMVLKYVLESTTGKSFWNLVKEYILEPCGMNHTYCNVPEECREKCMNNNYERKIINGQYSYDCSTEKGVCHDTKARILKRNDCSLQGHAGLFSTVEDMAKFAQCLIKERIITKGSMEIIGENYACERKEGQHKSQFFGLLSYVKNPV